MPAPDYSTEIAALEGALATGELTIEQNGERVTFQSFKDVKQRLDYFVSLAARATGGGAASQVTVAAYSRD